MSRERERLVMASLLLVESSWIYLLFSALGLGLGDRGALLSWHWVVVLLALGVGFQRWVVFQPIYEVTARVVGVTAGLAAIYGVVGLQTSDFGWPGTLGSAFSGRAEGLRVFMTLLAAMLIWWWGLHTASSGDYVQRLGRAFRMGLAVLIVAAVANAATPATFSVVPTAFVVFCSALAGFAIANVQRPEVHGAAWARLLVMGGGGILLAGVVVGLLAETVVGSAVAGAFGLLGSVAEAIIRVVLIPVEWIMRLVFFVLNYITQFITGGEGMKWPEMTVFEPPGETPESEPGDGLPGWLVGLVKWGLVALISGGALTLLYRVLWIGRRPEIARAEEVRESVREDVDQDDWSLLGLLLGKGRTKERPYTYPLPEGDDPATRVRRAYLRLLNLAIDRGNPREPWETPLEYDPRLSREFPHAPVPDVTRAFVRVRFGLLSPSTDEAGDVESAVERAGQRPAAPGGPSGGDADVPSEPGERTEGGP